MSILYTGSSYLSRSIAWNSIDGVKGDDESIVLIKIAVASVWGF